MRLAGVLLGLAGLSLALTAEPFVERFEQLDAWQRESLPGVEIATHYEATNLQGVTVLAISSQKGASFLRSRESVAIEEGQTLRWRWRVDRLPEGADGLTKEGDDMALRIAVIFPYDPDRLSWSQRARYTLYAELHDGEYPPHAALYYVWANHIRSEEHWLSPYTDRVAVIPKRAGGDSLKQWFEEEATVFEDYARIFGEEPPPQAYLGVMGDADNTGSASLAWLDWIRVEAGASEADD